MEPLIRADTEAPYTGVEVMPTSPTVSMTSRDEQRASALWRRLLHFRRTNPNSRLGLLSVNQLFDSFRVVLSEPARFGALVSSAATDSDGEASSLLETPIPHAGLQSLSLTAAGEFFQDSVGEVLSRNIADLLLLIPSTIGNTFEAAYLEHTVVSTSEVTSRKRAIVSVSQHMADCLCMLNIQEQLKVFLFGSVGLATVLPGGDNDVTLVLGDHQSRGPVRISDPWVPESPPSGSFDAFLQTRAPPNSQNPALDFLEEAKNFILRKVEAQNAAINSGNMRDPDSHPRQLIQIHGEVINAAVPLLKLDYQDQHIDISLDQMGGRTSMIFVHRVDESIGQNNLFRRSLLLVKHYCSSVLHVLGAQAGGLGSYTVTVMLLALFNGLPSKVLEEGLLEKMGDGTSRRVPLTPLKILIMFLDYYAHFDFDSYVVTIFGPLPVSVVQLTNHENTEAARSAYQQWIAITEIDSDANSTSASATAPGRTSDFGSPNSNFNPQGEMHKANGFNVFGRSFREQASSPSGNLLSPSTGIQSGHASGRSSEAGGAVSPIESSNVGIAAGGKAISLDPPVQGGDCCPSSVLGALESAPGVAQPSGPNHYSDHCIKEEFVEEYIHTLSSEDRDLAFAQKIFFFPRTRTSHHGKAVHHHATLSGEVLPPAPVISSTSNTSAPKPIAASLFKVRMMNIRDPLRPFSNLTPGVQRSSLCRIQAGFAKGVEALRASIYSVCFTDVDGTKYNPERVLDVVSRELNLRKKNPTEDTPSFHGIKVDVGNVAELFKKRIAPNRKEHAPAEGEIPPPLPSDEKGVNPRHVEDMLVHLASHTHTLLPPPVTDTQQFWASLIPYVRQVHTSSMETVSPPLTEKGAEDPNKIFGIFKMSYEDIKKPISEFKAPTAQDSAMMAKQYPHHHHGGMGGHNGNPHHHLPPHHHVPPHAQHQHQQQQHQQQQNNSNNNNNNNNQMNGPNSGAVGRRQSNQASYGMASPAPESHTSATGAPPLDSTLNSRPTSQHSGAYHGSSPSYGKSKQPGNSEAPPLPRAPSGNATPAYGGGAPLPQQQQQQQAHPAPRSHNPYMPSSAAPPPTTPNAELPPTPQQTTPSANGTSPQQSPQAGGRGRGGGRGGVRGRGIQ